MRGGKVKPLGVGPIPEMRPMPWPKNSSAILAACLILGVASMALLVHPWYDPVLDSSMYIVCARSIAEGEGYTFLGNPVWLHPPGFSFLIAPLISSLGTHFRALNFYVGFFGLAGVVLLFFFQRPRVGWITSLLVASAVWFNPGYRRLCNQTMSDIPGVALLLAGLLADRHASRKPSVGREVLLGLCIGLSAYVRSLIILLVPAIMTSRLLHRLSTRERDTSWRSFAVKRLGVFAVSSMLVLLPWELRNHAVKSSTPGDQTLVHSYSVGMLHVDRNDPRSGRISMADFIDRIHARGGQIAKALGTRMKEASIENRLRPRHALVASIFVLCTLIVLVKRRAPADFFCIGTLLLLSVYFGFRSRLVLPFYVLSLAAVFEVLQDLLRRFLEERIARMCIFIAILVLVMVDFQPRERWDYIRQRHQSYVSTCSEIDSMFTPDTRFGAGLGFHYNVYLDRPVYSLLPAVIRAGDVRKAEAIIGKYHLDAIILEPSSEVPMNSELVAYLLKRYGESVRIGKTVVVRVHS
jgi:hypothetical protein